MAVARIVIRPDGSGTWAQSVYPHANELDFAY